MIDTELQELQARLDSTEFPEDLFGPITGLLGLKSLYRTLAKIVHPDRHLGADDKEAAEGAFKKLNDLFEGAQRKLEQGTYGDRRAGDGRPILLHTKKQTYSVGALTKFGEFANIYQCSYGATQAILKVARQPINNGLLQTEADKIKQIYANTEHARFQPYIPQLIDSFNYRDGSRLHRASVFNKISGVYSLEQIIGYYPKGVDPKDVAWMFRRLLVAIGFAHASGVSHGAITPQHVLIQPEDHGLILIDWTGKIGSKYDMGHMPNGDLSGIPNLPATVTEFLSELQQGLDIFLAARTMVYILGNLGGVPRPLKAFLLGCMQRNPYNQPQDAWKLKEEFDELIEKMWGKRTFHLFTIPKEDHGK